MEERLEFALGVARQAGTLIKEGFGGHHTVQTKQDDSPVTEVDRQINHLVAQRIHESFPEDGLLGEEGGFGDGYEEYQWICDPLDGTKPFLLGIPVSVFMIGVSKAGKMLLAVVYNPYEDVMYHAVRGCGAFSDNTPIHVNAERMATGYVLIGSDSFPFVPSLKEKAPRLEPVPGTGYKFIMIATGRAVGMANDYADFYDVGPGSLLVEEAGGIVTDMDGAPLCHGRRMHRGVVVSNGVVHTELLQVSMAKPSR